MSKNTFFKPTALYKEFLILDLIEKNKNITQREIANQIDVAVSMINSYIEIYESKGLIKRRRYSTKTVEYFLTKIGNHRKKLLHIKYLSSSQKVYDYARRDIEQFLFGLSSRGIIKLLFYGAGDVANIIFQTITSLKNSPIQIIGIVDDDISKQGKDFFGYIIQNNRILSKLNFDGIVISTYSGNEKIYDCLISNSIINNKKIIRYFD